MEIEQIGDRIVKIGDCMIPAANVQVEGFPAMVDGHHYGIYFDVMWEKDYGLSVSQIEIGFPIEIEIWVGKEPIDEFMVDTWNDFVVLFRGQQQWDKALANMNMRDLLEGMR